MQRLFDLMAGEKSNLASMIVDTNLNFIAKSSKKYSKVDDSQTMHPDEVEYYKNLALEGDPHFEADIELSEPDIDDDSHLSDPFNTPQGIDPEVSLIPNLMPENIKPCK